MKQYNFFILILVFSYSNLIGQTTDVITGIGQPRFMVIKGNDLYFSEDLAGKISKIDISDPTPTVIDVVTGLDGPRGLVFKGNILYFTERNTGNISKFNITDSLPKIKVVATGFDEPIYLAFNGNYLYVSEFEGDKVSRINVSFDRPPVTDVVTGIDGPQGLAFKGSELYIAISIGNKISKIDTRLASPKVREVVSGLNFPRDIVFDENLMYLSEFIGNKVTKVDLSTNETTDIDASLKGPIGLVAKNDQLYIAVFGDRKIAKLKPPSTDIDFGEEESFNLYPNPSMNFIMLSGLTETESYSIYNISGKEISHGIVSNMDKIDIRNLTIGLYFLHLIDREPVKFLRIEQE